MKLTRVLAAAIAIMLIVAGCTTRNNGNNGNGTNTSAPSAPAASMPDLTSRLEEGASRLQSGIEEGMSRIDESMEIFDNDDMSGVTSEDLETSRPVTDQSAITDESVAAAMSTDFSEIGALDATSDSGFPGGPVDAQNRPSGPLGYQAKYGKYDALFIVPDSQKIYLTFDEGYENGYTSRILDVLKEKNVKAVFFITYPYAKTETALVKRMVEEGHTLGNHSTAHKSFPTMPLAEAAKDILKLHEYVKANYGYEMFLFRPPEGAFSEQTLALAQSLGYKTMLWSFAYNDYDVNNQPLTIEAQNKIVSKAHPGEICLLHAVSKTNTEILGSTIDQLRREGFVFADYFGF